MWFIFQVVIRVRPLNNMEKNLHGYNRCLKQENAQRITWIGQPETRFTFDHVACEGVSQVSLKTIRCRDFWSYFLDCE
jgi:kinesin family protein 15